MQTKNQSIECEEGCVMLIASIVTVKVFRFGYHVLEISIGLGNVQTNVYQIMDYVEEIFA